jgi:ribA/ribD-fused uncharacterized protein
MQPDIDKYCIWDERRISGFFKEYRWLSNFHVCPVKFDGIFYPSSENAYMAAKTVDSAERKVLESLKPSEARKYGQSVKLRDDWEIQKLKFMYIVNLDKYSRHEELAEKLLETGKKVLEENNWWGDKFYGVCNGQGKNYLGKLLMEIRQNLFL